MKKKSFSLELAGKQITADFSDLAGQANGSVIIRMGETAVLVTAVMGSSETTLPYFPLSVEFEEKFYAAGAILGSRFVRREGRPSEEAVLSARIIDRTIRPLFDHKMKRDVQVVATVLAMGEDDPDVLSVIGASLALTVSDIPWDGPVGAVRIGLDENSGDVLINPTYKDRENGRLVFEVLSCGKEGKINMIETAANEVSEDDIVAILEASTKVQEKLENWQKEIRTAIGTEKVVIESTPLTTEAVSIWNDSFAKELETVLFSNKAGKDHIYELKDRWLKTLAENEIQIEKSIAVDWFEDKVDEELHRGAIDRNLRADGRGMDEVRELYAQAGNVSPVLHGSGIFYRGGTHVFTALTLGGPEAAQLIDTIEERDLKKGYIHHYNFPPFSVGETGRVGGFNRRMIGHGALAEKALVPVIPDKAEFPYTIRLVSETMSSNGSSSMASVCGSTLALMDGGVPIKRPVAGIASGLMMHDDEHYALLTDIQGPEDEHGDMDFKVAGTREGVTAIQMDVKVGGIPVHILAEALEKAKLARLQILDTIEEEIASPRENISPRAPEIITLKIDPAQIGLVIGSGGKTINGIKDKTGVEEITIEEDGNIFITGKNGSGKLAAKMVEDLTKTFEVGEQYDVTITKLADFGAFAKIDDQNEGLIHISEVAPFRVEKLEGLLKVGDIVPAVVSKVEEGKIGLSIKQRDPEFAERKGFTKPE
ncbi:polyribonucleotide nucleotidyltransferase [bacterium]|nr:polyribonucleotide nucleotidyltransferase [bacterium]